MLFTTKENIEEKIIRLLIEKDQSAKSLTGKISSESSSVTIQAIYKALRALVAHEVVTKHKFSYFLNEDWRIKALRYLEKQDHIELEEGEKVSFSLGSLIHLDQQWKNIVLPLGRDYAEQPVFMYNPHYIWTHLSDSRKESEQAYFETFERDGKDVFCLIGGKTACDKIVKKKLENKFVHVELGMKSFPDTDYPTIFGDYIITTRVGEELAQNIENNYEVAADIPALEEKLRKLGVERKKIRLSIERNKEKARKLRKRIAKGFFIPQETIKKFDLF